MGSAVAVDGSAMYSTNSGSYYNLPHYGYTSTNAGQNSVDMSNNGLTIADSLSASLGTSSSSIASTYMQSKCHSNTSTSSSNDLQQQNFGKLTILRTLVRGL